MESEFTCKRCGLTKPVNHDGGTGYGVNAQGEKICYLCIAELDKQTMIETGSSRTLPLYLSGSKVSNWPGTLEFHPYYVRHGKHNIGRTRTDVWFYGPDGHVWHGVQIGDFNQILHAKRTKEPVNAARHC